MVVTEKGRYELLQDIKVRNSCMIGTLPKGTIIEITQIDRTTHKAIGEQLADWMYWDLPVRKID